MDTALQSPIALVTGAGRGIGRTISLALADAGWSVGLTARTAAELNEVADSIRHSGGRAAVCVGDASDPVDVQRVVDAISRDLGPIDLLVNNAGVSGTAAPFLDVDPGDWWETVTTNLRAPALFMSAVLPAMVARGAGRVVNLNSLQASAVSGSASIAYGVSKAGLCRLTESLAHELEATGVALFDLSPGLVRTGMTAGRPDLDALPSHVWSPATAAAGLVVQLAQGGFDVLSGRFIRVGDDLHALSRSISDETDARILRMTPATGDSF